MDSYLPIILGITYVICVAGSYLIARFFLAPWAAKREWERIRYLAKYESVPDPVHGEVQFVNKDFNVDVRYDVNNKKISVRDYREARSPISPERIWDGTRKNAALLAAAPTLQLSFSKVDLARVGAAGIETFSGSIMALPPNTSAQIPLGFDWLWGLALGSDHAKWLGTGFGVGPR